MGEGFTCIIRWRRWIAAQIRRSLCGETQGCRIAFVTAVALLIEVGDNPERLGSEASFAALAGVSPVERSSGRRQFRGFNRGGDHQANAAVHWIVVTRLRVDPRTQDYYERRIKEGKTAARTFGAQWLSAVAAVLWGGASWSSGRERWKDLATSSVETSVLMSLRGMLSPRTFLIGRAGTSPTSLASSTWIGNTTARRDIAGSRACLRSCWRSRTMVPRTRRSPSVG